MIAASWEVLQVDPEALVSGASVMFVPEPKGHGEQNWEWCDHASPESPACVSGRSGRQAPAEGVDREAHSRSACRVCLHCKHIV